MRALFKAVYRWGVEECKSEQNDSKPLNQDIDH